MAADSVLHHGGLQDAESDGPSNAAVRPSGRGKEVREGEGMKCVH